MVDYSETHDDRNSAFLFSSSRALVVVGAWKSNMCVCVCMIRVGKRRRQTAPACIPRLGHAGISQAFVSMHSPTLLLLHIYMASVVSSEHNSMCLFLPYLGFPLSLQARCELGLGRPSGDTSTPLPSVEMHPVSYHTI